MKMWNSVVPGMVQGRVQGRVQGQVRDQAMKTTNTSATAPLGSPANFVKPLFLASQIRAKIQEIAKIQPISVIILVIVPANTPETIARHPFLVNSTHVQ